MRRMPSWSQKIEARTFPAVYCTWNFLGQGEPLCHHSIDCCFVCRSWWYNQVSSLVTNRDRISFGSRWKNSRSCLDDWHHWRFWSAFRHFGTHFAESFHMSKSSWMMDPTHSLEMPSCSAVDLAEIRRSSKISSWIWSIISGVVTVLGHPGRGTSRVEKSPRLNWATQFLTVTYNGACSPVSLRMVCISFSALPCRKKNLMTARVLMLLKSRVLPDMLPFSLCNKKDLQSAHEQTPLSSDTIDSVLRHWEVRQAKDLSAPSLVLTSG